MDVVIGAGMGGLAAAIRLAQAGRRVTVFEARDRVGGLAGGLDLDGYADDAGPYILLDRPGLEWAFARLGADLGEHIELLPLDETWRVRRPGAPDVVIRRDLDATAEGIEASYPGAGAPYRAFVQRMADLYAVLAPLQRRSRPSPFHLLRPQRLPAIPFLVRGLAHHFRSAGLPSPVVDALGIWTHIAGQPLEAAPAPLAFVPAIVHTHGAYTVRGGIRRVPEALGRIAEAEGVQIRLGARVDRLVRDGRRVLGVEVAGERVSAERVFSDVGVGTYLALLDPPEPRTTERVGQLPLQSPGVAAWLTFQGGTEVPFLTFWLPEREQLPAGPRPLVRLLIHPGAVDSDRRGQARLLSPVDHSWAQSVGRQGQAERLEHLLAEPWWRKGLVDVAIRHKKLPVDWGRTHHLWRDAMNPVMTAAFMRRGRLAHRSTAADNLHLVGSATHPGQWVSFCAISGVIAAEDALGG